MLCDKTLLFNWQAEVKKWTTGYNPVTVPEKGSESRVEMYDAMRAKTVAPTVYIVNYDKVLLADWPSKIQWDCIILDEAQIVKNTGTARHRRIKAMAKKATAFFALTGTPMETSLEELYGIFSVVRPSVFGTKTRFKQQHIIYDWAGKIVGAQNVPLLQERIGLWLTRRTKADVLPWLPPKLYNVYTDKLDAWGAEHYKKLAKGIEAWLTDDSDANNQMNVLAKLVRCQQFTSSPNLLSDDWPRGDKYDMLVRIIDEWPGKVLVFSRFRRMVERLCEWLDLPERATITGGVSSAEERLKRVDDFNAGKLGKVFVGNDAMQRGFNITGADLILHYDKLWNPAREWQREDRLHRIGQENVVNVGHLLMEGTIDEAMHEVTKQRISLIDEVIGGAEATTVRRYSPQDFKQMIWGKVA